MPMKNDNQKKQKKEESKETPAQKPENQPVFAKPPNVFAKSRPFNNFNIRKVEFQGSRHRG